MYLARYRTWKRILAERIGNALFIHGAGGGGWEWKIWTRLFSAAGLAVAVPDLQPSAVGLAGTRLPDYSAQVRQAALALAAPRVLVGASLGGLLALIYGDLADALVLINPLPPAPWHAQMPVRDAYPAIVPWRREASLAGTRRSLPDADAAACLFAFRHWRDESGAVLNEALAGVAIAPPRCPVLVIASGRDDDVPHTLSLQLAQAFSAQVIDLPEASHVGPLLGKGAASIATRTVAWVNGLGRRQ